MSEKQKLWSEQYVNPVPWLEGSARHGQDEAAGQDSNPYRSAGRQLEANPVDWAPGMDGDLLDSNLKTRYIEGWRRGEEEGARRQAARFSSIFEQGRAQGETEQQRAGEEALRIQKASFVLGTRPPLERLRSQLMILASRAKPGGLQQQGLDEVTEIVVGLLAAVEQNADQLAEDAR